MNKQSNSYIITYSTIMVIVVAAILSFAATSLKSRQDANVELEKKGNILESVGLLKVEAGQDKNNVITSEYDKFIKRSFLVNRAGDVVSEDTKATFAVFINLAKEYAKPASEQTLPVFIATLADGQEKYIFPVNGTGLWGPIWGYIALDANMNTVYGVVFDHSSETPGLGAEITGSPFRNQFISKALFDGTTFVGIKTVKGNSNGNIHQVDAITGGTITSRAVEEMIHSSMNAYSGYLLKNMKNNQ